MAKQSKEETMLFDLQTTYKTDYRGHKIKTPIFTTYVPKPSCHRIRPPPLKDVHTLSDWKTTGIPFHLLHKPRPITDENPRKVQQQYEKVPDLGRENAIKTRPRVIMPTAVGMDDIEDPNARAILVEAAYTSSTTTGLREGITEYFKVQAPFPGNFTPANPMRLPKLLPPYVSPEWRKQTVSWDNHSLRSYCDPTKEFWMRQQLNKCRACEESKIIKAHRAIPSHLKTGNR